MTQAKPEGALLVVTEDMEVLTGLEEIQIHIHIYKYTCITNTDSKYTKVLAVSDGVADLLGVGVVEIMGSQLTDMVTHISSMQHPYENLFQELF